MIVENVYNILPESNSQGPLPIVGETGAGSNPEPNAAESLRCPLTSESGVNVWVSPEKADIEILNFFATGRTISANLDLSSDTEL